MKRQFDAGSQASSQCPHLHCCCNLMLTAMHASSSAQSDQLTAIAETQMEDVAALAQLQMQPGALWLL